MKFSRKKRYITPVILSALLLIYLFICSYSFGPFFGRVVDADTGKPIEDAQIFVEVGYTPAEFGPGHSKTFRKYSATNKLGWYLIGRMGSKIAPELTSLKFVAYKKGYVAFDIDWNFYEKKSATDFRESFYTVKLHKWDFNRFSDVERLEHARNIRRCDISEESEKFCSEIKEESIFVCVHDMRQIAKADSNHAEMAKDFESDDESKRERAEFYFGQFDQGDKVLAECINSWNDF